MHYNFDYSKEPRRDIAFVDMKSFYASCEAMMKSLDPLKACLAVMSNAANSKGLILASSPVFKWAFGKGNVSRSGDLPFDIDTRRFNWKKWNKEHRDYFSDQVIPPDPDYVAFIEEWGRKAIFTPPSMAKYIEVNGVIQKALREEITSPEDIWWYSIDECFLDLTSVLNYHCDPKLSKIEKLDQLSKKIQRTIYDVTQEHFKSDYGIISTVGMSNSNPLLAKVALDVYAKHEPTMRALINYEDVPEKLWTIKEMTDFWGIGRRTEKRLNKIGIHSIKELANANPEVLKKELGVIGLQLYCHANGIDESRLSEGIYKPKHQSIGNSSTLPYDYVSKESILLVISELAEQVAIRLRKIHKEATVVSLYVGFALQENQPSIHVSKKIEPTNSTRELLAVVKQLFLSKYHEGAVRRLSISYGDLISQPYHMISLFDNDRDLYQLEKEEKLEEAVDEIRAKYGFTSLLRLSALQKDSRTLERSRMIGGHSAGGLDGLQ